MKRTLLAVCAALAICAVQPVMVDPAHAQEMSRLTIAQLEDRLTGMMLADGRDAITSQEYARAYDALKERMADSPTADQLNRFQRFPRPFLPSQSLADDAAPQAAGEPMIVYFGFDREKLTDAAHQTLDEVREAFVEDRQPSDVPEVVKVSPSRNAEGVTPGTQFVLTFSEPMDNATVEDNFVTRSFVDNDEEQAEPEKVSTSRTSSSTDAVATGLAVLELTEAVETPASQATAEETSNDKQWYDDLDTSQVQDSILEPAASPDEDDNAGLGGPIVKDKLWFFVGTSQVDIPTAGYGVEVREDDERYVAETKSKITGNTFRGVYLGDFDYTRQAEYEALPYLQRKWRGRANAFTAGLSYTQAEGSSSGSVAAGGNGTGVVYFDFADDDATGLFYGPAGSDVQTETELERFRFNVARKVYREINPDFYWGCYHGLFYDYQGTDHEFSITTPSYPDIYTFGRQDLTERYVGAEVGPFFGRKIDKVSLHLLPLLNVGFRDADLDARQDTFCGACYYSQNVPIRLADDDSGLTYGMSLHAGIGLEVAKGLDVGISFEGRWRADSAAIENPESGDDLFVDNQPTRLTTEQLSEQKFLFSISKDL